MSYGIKLHITGDFACFTPSPASTSRPTATASNPSCAISSTRAPHSKASAQVTTLHAEGIDGIFPDSAQVDSLLELLNNLNLTAA